MIQRFKMYHWNIVFPMKTSKALLFKFLIVPLVLGMNDANAQTPADAEMMPTGDLCFFLGYDYGSFDEYWEGSKLRTNATIALLNLHNTHQNFHSRNPRRNKGSFDEYREGSKLRTNATIATVERRTVMPM